VLASVRARCCSCAVPGTAARGTEAHAGATCCEVLTGGIGLYIAGYICMVGWPAVERAARDDQARELQGSQAALGC